jgi:plasmid maintenance system antidote protein VapI
MNLPELLRQRCRDYLATGWSVKSLAKELGWNQPTLSRFLSGQRDISSEKAGFLIESLGGKVEFEKLSEK